MVENDTSSVEYQLSTSTGPFSIPFYFIENGHIVAELYTQNGDDFNKTTLTIDVDYYLNGAGDKNGGQLTLLSAHSGATLLIYRDPDATQLTSYLATGKFPATSHERALDKLTMLIQKFGWWWDSLALKKPNIFANYYDALNNRIRNLHDPSLAQDAATKSYVDSSDIDLQQQITSNFNRSLRVPDSYISQLPSAQDRAWKGLGFDGAGQPKLQDPAGTGLWGYVPAIGSFEQGSLLTQRFEVLLWESTDEYWRWDGAMPKIVLPGSTPDTAGGRGKGKWLDVTDATLRSNLGSDEEGNSGGTLVALEEKISVQDALSPMLYSGRVVRLSVFYARGLTNDAAFAAAFEASKNTDGYNCRIIINDTPHVVEITDTIYQFRTNLETRYNLNTYSGFNCGVVGEFKFNGTAQFKFIRCYRPYVNVVIQGGTGIAGIDTTTPTNSSVAVQLDTVVVGAEIHIDIVNYPGYGLATFGTKFLTSQGVKGLYPSTVNAYLSGGAVYMAGTNGFGEFSSIWELDCTHGSVFNAIYDVVVHKYEGSDLLVNICNSIRFGYLLLGVANAKIFDSQGVYVGHHLGVAGASATVKQTEDLFVMDIVNSWVRFGQSRLFGANCGFRIGSAANVLFDSLEGYHINQAISITNNTSYTGTSNSPTVDVHVKQINVVNGNGQYAYSSKHCIHVDDEMLANLTLEDGRIQWNVNGRTSEYAYAIYGGSLSTSHIKIDNVRLLGNYDAEPVYMPNYDCIVKMHTPDTEVNVGGTRTTGSGRRLRINWGMSTAETEYTSKPNKRVYVVATVNAAGGNFIARVDGKPAMYAAGVAGTFSGTFEVSKGQKAYYSMASSSVVDSYAELELG